MDVKDKPKAKPRSFYRINKTHLRKLVEAGWTDQAICDFFNLNSRVLERWKARYPDFKETMNKWKEKADAQAERSLFENVTGFYRTETKVFMVKGKALKVNVEKFFRPDIIAQIFWLTNRKHGDWKRTREETGKDPLSEAIYKLMKDRNKIKDSGGNGKLKKESDVEIKRGGLTIVN